MPVWSANVVARLHDLLSGVASDVGGLVSDSGESTGLLTGIAGSTASSDAKLSTSNASLASIDGKLSTSNSSLSSVDGNMHSVEHLLNTGLAGDPLRRATLGLSADLEYFGKYGRNLDVDANSAPEDIWETGGLYTGFPTGAAETVTVVSSSANDTSAGTGMRTLRLTGLDADFNPRTEVITLNGVTPVTTATTWTRVHRARGVTGGSGGTNAGTITVKHTTTTANVFCSILPGIGQSQACAYTVRAGHTGLVVSMQAGVSNLASTAQEAQVSWMIREYGSSVWRASHIMVVGTGGPSEFRLIGGVVLPEKTDLVARVLTATSDNLVATALAEVFVVPNSIV